MMQTTTTRPDMDPVIITGAADMARVLASRRLALGMTVEELDAVAGLQERYSGKLEHPEQHWGRGSLHLTPMGEIWIEALGLRLVLMSEEQAKALGAADAPKQPRKSTPPTRDPFEVSRRTREISRRLHAQQRPIKLQRVAALSFRRSL